MGTRVFEYFLGDPVETDEGITFVSLASAGDPAAKTRLVYPGSPPALNPVTYFTNPDRRLGFDNDDVINSPARTAVETLDDLVVMSFDRTIVDRIVVERWTAANKLSMSTAMMRELRGYHENPPDPDVDGYITWQPANQSTKTFQIQMIALKIGSQDLLPDATEFRPIGGGGVNAGPDEDLGVEFASAGWQDVDIEQRFRIIAEV